MAGLKYSRQREAILSYLHSTKEHPTADVVYEHVGKQYPKISLGTVYRNLNLLTECGQAMKVTCDDGFDHFDGNPDPHYHFICSQCGRVLDLELDGLDQLDQMAAKNFGGTIEGHKAYFYGKCPNCK